MSVDDDQGAREQASKIVGELVAEIEQSEVSDTGDDADEDADTGSEDDEADAGDTDEGDDEGEGEGESDDEAEAESDDDEDDEEGDKPKKSTRRERYKRRMERLEHENAQLRSRQQAGKPDAASIERRVAEIIGAEPKEADFNGDYLAYERAQTAWELDKRQTTREVKRESEQQQRESADTLRRKAEDHEERVADFRKKTADFDKVMANANQLKASPVLEELILDSDKSAHLIYFLAKNPAQLTKLNGMSEREAAREVGRIESRLTLPQPKTKTNAPPPPKTPKGGAAPKSPDAEISQYLKKTYGRN